MEKDVKGFCEFEKDNDMFSRKYLGIPYWQYIRFAVCEGIFSPSIENKETIQKSKSKIKAVKDVIAEIKQARVSTKKLKTVGIREFICFKTTKGHDRFYDYWKMPEEIDYLNIRCNNDPTCISRNEINILEPYLKANISFLTKKKLHIIKRDAKEYEFLQSTVEKLTDKYGKCPTADYLEGLILRYSEYKKFYTPFWEKLFDSLQCKAFMVVWYYQVPMMIAYQIAKQRGIQIIELQHGVINNHEEYWFEDQRGVNNFTPDYFLAFGKQHIEWTKMLPSTLCLSVGYPFQDYMKSNLENIVTDERTIIIYPETNKDFETLIDNFVNLIVEKNYRILMKLHPLQTDHYEVYYPILAKNRNIQVITDQSKGIYYWLKLGKHHIMANTTVGHEALVFPHTNICIATNVNHEQMQPLLDWGFARGFNNVDELLHLIDDPLSSKSTMDRSNLWEDSGKKNIELFLSTMKHLKWPGVENREKIISAMNKIEE